MAIQDLLAGILSGLYKILNLRSGKILIKKFYQISGQRSFIRKLTLESQIIGGVGIIEEVGHCNNY